MDHPPPRGPARIDFQTDPSRYRHWKLSIDGAVATLAMDVDPAGGLFDGYELKLNSYDLGVDIELADAIQRLRFEHPEVRAVVLRSAKEGVFCAGANIRMLGRATHAHKVNFCKFTNETRLGIEDSSENSRQFYLAAVSGTAAGGGYELAVTAEHIMLIDDRRSGVSLPETPLLAVLPGTGGLTRLTDKRRVRRDRADVFCSTEEGVRGRRAVEWRVVDEVVPPSAWEATVRQRALEWAAKSDRPADAKGVALTPLDRTFTDDGVRYSLVRVEIDRAARRADITLRGPDAPPPADVAGIAAEGAQFWPLRLGRELDDALLHLRANEAEIGLLVFRTEGDPAAVLAYDALLERAAGDWLVREVRHYLKRVFKRVDMTSRSLIALIEPGSCFAGTLAEIAFAADRSVIFAGVRAGDNKPPATITLSPLNFGAYPMGNGLTRLQTRFLGEPQTLAAAQATAGTALDADAADAAGLVTFAYDETDWDDEVRIMLEERASFSPDALTGMEANLRFAGPETMETRIFGRLTAWQNWIFQRPNAVGDEGALKRYGSGIKPAYNPQRV
ncbi:2,3-epoxybenzoyl-CoA dihydrolase [Acidisphaera rubrifaciens]|uniref:Enoyl-CoA hydratase/isomerase n=1 Tax=Acidisphaera rubrifaciens HS-AP3 TaxID=1231350 RepID=A0A0D6P4P9_9PROT|nr:2,3-epoxybenzoyl-CoA dihydrolase [Acidisphaera rubrifaciens]GAN75869.1 enoyl-CoA hydratase/isomerase [Acidisphaera rubrifaciens HS-AP3]